MKTENSWQTVHKEFLLVHFPFLSPSFTGCIFDYRLCGILEGVKMTLMAMVGFWQYKRRRKKTQFQLHHRNREKWIKSSSETYTTSKPAKPQFPRFGYNQRVHFQSIGKNIEIVLCLSLRNDAWHVTWQKMHMAGSLEFSSWFLAVSMDFPRRHFLQRLNWRKKELD